MRILQKGIRHYYRASILMILTIIINYDTGQQTNAIVKLDQQAPPTPTLKSRTSTSITLNAIDGCEYRVGTGAWQR